jgi:hypothetical protein
MFGRNIDLLILIEITFERFDPAVVVPEFGTVAPGRGKRLDHHIFVVAANDGHPTGIVAPKLNRTVNDAARIFTAIDQISDQNQMIFAGAILTLFQQALK